MLTYYTVNKKGTVLKRYIYRLGLTTKVLLDVFEAERYLIQNCGYTKTETTALLDNATQEP